MNVRQEITDQVEAADTAVVFLDPEEYDAAIIGLQWDVSGQPHVAYDRDRIIDMHMKDGMSREEAEEYFEFNTIRALPYMGIEAPIFIEVMKKEDAMDIPGEFDEDHREAAEN